MGNAIEVAELVKTYGELHAVNGLDLEIEEGHIFALLGPNGAGKSTTVEILEGFRKRTSGHVSVLGADPEKAGRAWREKLGIVLQSTAVSSLLTVRESVTHMAHLYPHPREVDEVIDAVGLTEKADAKAMSMSGGQQRRLEVALAVVGRPELVFLDEPTTGFGPDVRRAFWKLIRSIKDDGSTIVLTTHYLDEADYLADKVAIIAQGAKVAEDTPAGLRGRAGEAVVRWRDASGAHEKRTTTPTAFARTLLAKHKGEVPDLEISRPSLEDVYLDLTDLRTEEDS